jgi:excisionase family DNA binding protein
MSVSFEGMVTVAEAARRLGRSQEQIRRRLREGKLKGQRIGGQWFVEEASVDHLSNKLSSKEIEAFMKRVDRRRRAIRQRLGYDLDVVRLLRESREGLR